MWVKEDLTVQKQLKRLIKTKGRLFPLCPLCSPISAGERGTAPTLGTPEFLQVSHYPCAMINLTRLWTPQGFLVRGNRHSSGKTQHLPSKSYAMATLSTCQLVGGGSVLLPPILTMSISTTFPFQDHKIQRA